eukprot:TRINITY_DN56477_c0_g1_i1.p1 TRINITY_DN56477_c0_g1~~TRINITY_DN56477_c0_g1_i1.p1  ORF type:complete len:101 (+),score=7.17 TRINITY_DN56477_c0_g1_i1:3-305(+)
MNIVQCVQTRTPIGQLQPLVHSIVWSTSRLNLTAIKEFSNLIQVYMNKDIHQVVETSPLVDLELKKYLQSATPSPTDTREYLFKFCDRNQIDPMLIDELW